MQVDVNASEAILEPMKRNLDTLVARAIAADATSDIKTPLSAKLDSVIAKVERDTRDDKLLARCDDTLSAARSALSGDAVFVPPGAPSAAPVGGTAASGGFGTVAGRGGFAAGSAGRGTATGAAASGPQAPMPPDWEEVRQGNRTSYVNAKTKQRSETRPVMPRESVSQLLQVVHDMFLDQRPGVASVG